MNEYLFFETTKTVEVAPTTFESFFKTIIHDKSAKVSEERIQTEDDMCLVCSNSQKLDVKRIVRSCQCSPYACEGHECGCSKQGDFFPVCSDCLANCLWKGSADKMKQEGRYRSKCPLCKAVFI